MRPVLLAVAFAFVACSLNPQPLPPDTFYADAAAGTPSNADAAVADAAFSADGGATLGDGATPPGVDDGGDASDAHPDGPVEAADGGG